MSIWRRALVICGALLSLAVSASAQQAARPNIVVIFGDDIGYWNLGIYSHGMMGRTPNIDRIGREGALFTDHYGQPSCTAGRAAFLMGHANGRTTGSRASAGSTRASTRRRPAAGRLST